MGPWQFRSTWLVSDPTNAPPLIVGAGRSWFYGALRASFEQSEHCPCRSTPDPALSVGAGSAHHRLSVPDIPLCQVEGTAELTEAGTLAGGHALTVLTAPGRGCRSMWRRIQSAVAMVLHSGHIGAHMGHKRSRAVVKRRQASTSIRSGQTTYSSITASQRTPVKAPSNPEVAGSSPAGGTVGRGCAVRGKVGP